MFFYSNFHQKNGYLIKCSAITKTSYSGMNVTLFLSMKFWLDNNGEIKITGDMSTTKGDKYKISRVISFPYSLSSHSYVLMHNYSVRKSIIDDTPDNLFDIMVFDVTKKEIRLFIYKKDNSFVFSNGIAPMFICVDNT
jgi:hypothetical protein